MRYLLIINGKAIERSHSAETLKRHGAQFKVRNRQLDVKVVRDEARTATH